MSRVNVCINITPSIHTCQTLSVYILLQIYCITLFRSRQHFLGNFNNFAFYTVNILTKSHINKAIADMGNGKELLKLYVEENDVGDDGIVNCKI